MSPRDKLEPISRLSVNLSFLDLWLCKPRLAGQFGDGYVPIPEIIDRVKLLDGLVLVRVYMRIQD